MFNGNFRRYALDNGLRIGLQNHPGPTISLRLTVRHAGIHEYQGEGGFGHFVEHILMVDGSKIRTVEEADAIRAKFGYNIPEIEVDWVCTPIGIIPERLELTLDYLADIVFSPRFAEVPIERQRRRILREIADEKSMPDFRDNQDYHKALLGGHPCNYNLHGHEKNVKDATIDDLMAFHSRGYHPNNAHLIISGPLPPNVELLIQKYFGGIPSGTSSHFQFPPIMPLTKKVIINRDAPELYDHDFPMETKADLRLGIVVPPFTSTEGPALTVIAHSLISHSDSRIFKTVSDADGLAYEIDGGYLGSFNRGVIEIRGPIKAQQVEAAIDSIFREMARLRTEPMKITELEAVIDDLHYRTLRKLERSSGSALLIEGVFETDITPDEWHRGISALTPEQIMAVAQCHLPPDRETGKYVLLVRNPTLS